MIFSRSILQIVEDRMVVVKPRCQNDRLGLANLQSYTTAGVENVECKSNLGLKRHIILAMRKTRSDLGTNDPELLAAALVGYEQQRSEVVQKIDAILRQLGRRAEHNGHGALPAAETAVARRRTMSAAARRRIAAAQRKRWAAYHRGQESAANKTSAVQKASAKPMRRMSAAARKAISEATKKRWAAYRAKKAKNAA